jgi:hypothetical protein
LFDAIIKDKLVRLDLLLKTGVPLLSQWRYGLKAAEIDALLPSSSLWRDILYTELLSPLCCAVVYGRNSMLEGLLSAGASANEPGSNLALAPIHFAALSDSLEAFKILENHGADLEMKDRRGQNMVDLALGSVPRTTLPEKPLFHYLRTHIDSYLQYSWGDTLQLRC